VNHFTKFAVLALDKAKTEQPQTNEADFDDIKGQWYESNVRELVKLGAINGYPDHTFKPDANITRAEFVTLIVKAFQLGEQEGKTFADTETHWAEFQYQAKKWSYERRVVVKMEKPAGELLSPGIN
jgi:hypothetical protein